MSQYSHHTHINEWLAQYLPPESKNTQEQQQNDKFINIVKKYCENSNKKIIELSLSEFKKILLEHLPTKHATDTEHMKIWKSICDEQGWKYVETPT